MQSRKKVPSLLSLCCIAIARNVGKFNFSMLPVMIKEDILLPVIKCNARMSIFDFNDLLKSFGVSEVRFAKEVIL